jgi:DNA processing protein
MVGTRVTLEELLGPLDEIERKHAPAELFVEGDTSLVTKGARVSVVGSRTASPAGLKRAAKLASMLVERGIVVVSGLAEGIDTMAHETAIERGGRTIAVLGTRLDQCFPARNRALQQRIMREHLAVSQFAEGRPLGARAFPMRNRTMALLSDATVIVEAGARSGTVHQGWEALRLGRALYIMESLAHEGHAWVGELQRYGALVLSDSTKDLFLESIPEESRVERTEATF